MTSPAKNNHERMVSLFERLKWFGRGRSSFQLFEQVLNCYSDFLSQTCVKFSLLKKPTLILIISISSPLFLLLVLKMGTGSSLDSLCLYASLVVMVWYGNLPTIKVSFSGSAIMEEKGQLFGKSGRLWSFCDDDFTMFVNIYRMSYSTSKHAFHCWLCSNVVAATDLTLLALAGIGLRQKKVESNPFHHFMKHQLPSIIYSFKITCTHSKYQNPAICTYLWICIPF